MKQSKGFTIIELIISIFILSIAIIGVFNAFSIMTILTADTADRLTANYLAQEGMEIVRNIRDTNWLYMDTPPGDGINYDWTTGLNCPLQGCQADYTLNSLSPFIAGNYLRINPSGFYDYNDSNNSSPTKFKRRIFITQPLDANGDVIKYIIKVAVQVSWNQKATLLFTNGRNAFGQNQCNPANCVTVEETFYNWYNDYESNSDASISVVIGSEYVISGLTPNDDGTYSGTIANVLPDTTLTDFNSNLNVSLGNQKKQIWNYSNMSDPVNEDNTLVIFAEDGTKAIYGITFKQIVGEP